jgi:hypothetical protein
MADPFGVMLSDAMDGGRHYRDTGQAFAAAASQTSIRRILEACDWLVLDDRGRRQLSAANEAYVAVNFERRFPAEGVPGPDLWERRAEPGGGGRGEGEPPCGSVSTSAGGSIDPHPCPGVGGALEDAPHPNLRPLSVRT